MKFNKLFSTTLMAIAVLFSSCETDEPHKPSSSTSSTTTSKQTITKPSFDKFLSTADKASFSIRVRFKTGGDKEQNLSAIVHWRAYSSKPSKTPSKSDLTKVESMRQYGAATYYKTGSKKGMTESIVFDKSHAGYSGGNYIYYYVECRNSKGSATSSITYMVTPR
ncbi:MAG: hypothetical protein K2M87_00100 [Muribaculaceae bacterium]|nr:hypothetical protein [Muribaculaceae bacterium]